MRAEHLAAVERREHLRRRRTRALPDRPERAGQVLRLHRPERPDDVGDRALRPRCEQLPGEPPRAQLLGRHG